MFNKNGDAFSLLEPEPKLEEISEYVQNLSLPGFEKTQYGYMIMPDKQNGAGPIYFSIIRKEKSCFIS